EYRERVERSTGPLQPAAKFIQSMLLLLVLRVEASFCHVLQRRAFLITLLELLAACRDARLDAGAGEEPAIHDLSGERRTRREEEGRRRRRRRSLPSRIAVRRPGRRSARWPPRRLPYRREPDW